MSPPARWPWTTSRTGISALLLADLENQEWTAMLDTWKNDGTVEIDEELVRSYGAAA